MIKFAIKLYLVPYSFALSLVSVNCSTTAFVHYRDKTTLLPLSSVFEAKLLWTLLLSCSSMVCVLNYVTVDNDVTDVDVMWLTYWQILSRNNLIRAQSKHMKCNIIKYRTSWRIHDPPTAKETSEISNACSFVSKFKILKTNLFWSRDDIMIR